ncbi:hypothetical protein KKG41_02465 [Patescibacteria group bacterium]|nr:hypothetical protein [Patescibacteria group bacterium]MBU1889893.1 hypothetical protein [Patescibacteria group bacterium]
MFFNKLTPPRAVIFDKIYQLTYIYNHDYIKVVLFFIPPHGMVVGVMEDFFTWEVKVGF